MFVAEKGVSGQARVHVGSMFFSLKMGKKMLSEEILSSFTNVLPMKIGGGGGSTYTAYMQNGRDWADMRLSMVGGGGGRGVLPFLKKRGCQRKFESLSTIFYQWNYGGGGSAYIQNRRWSADRRVSMVVGGGEGALHPPRNGKNRCCQKTF